MIKAGILSRPSVHHLYTNWGGSAQSLAHRVGGLAAHLRQHVGVGVEGYDDGGVAEELLVEFGARLLAEQQRRAGVPEVVDAGVWQTCLFGSLQRLYQDGMTVRREMLGRCGG